MRTISRNEARSHLAELIESTAEDEDILIVARNDAGTQIKTDRPSLRDIRPVSVGKVLRPLSSDDDLLDEMLNP